VPLARLHAAFDHTDWVFEPKLDGFRGLAYIAGGKGRLVSRHGNTFKSFPELTRSIPLALNVNEAILDGEIVHVGPDGRPLFYDLMRRRSPQHFYAFDLLWLNGCDLRALPLLERKRRLRGIIPRQPSPVLYVDHVAERGVDLFAAACDLEGIVAKNWRVVRIRRRLLRDDGTLWLNIGDSYTSGGRTWRGADKKNPVRAMNVRPPTPEGLKPKDLIGVPWLLAFALQKKGWYLRADIIWNKPNCQPESVKDRPTRSHEYLFLFSKSEHYKYDSAALRGPKGRNMRTVWAIHTKPYAEAHFATFPPDLVKPPSDLVLDPFIGSGTTGRWRRSSARWLSRQCGRRRHTPGIWKFC
jgi:hypothetical protein